MERLAESHSQLDAGLQNDSGPLKSAGLKRDVRGEALFTPDGWMAYPCRSIASMNPISSKSVSVGDPQLLGINIVELTQQDVTPLGIDSV